MPTSQTSILREFIVRVALEWLGAPYRWGGQSWDGVDCSGFVIKVLRPFGLLPSKGDWTAQQLSNLFEKTTDPRPGDLVLYGKPTKPSHVMICLDNKTCIGATGGNSDTVSFGDALRQRAFVRQEPLGYRTDLIGFRNILSPTGR